MIKFCNILILILIFYLPMQHSMTIMCILYEEVRGVLMHPESIRPDDSFEALVTEYEKQLYRAALAILGNASEAQDVVQEVFIKLYEFSGDFNSKEHQKAWLLRVTINLCKNKLRSSWWKKCAPLLETIPAKDEEQHDLLEYVMSLPAKYRTVIHLYYYEGYSTKEIAILTRQKESTVRSLMARARTQLKDKLYQDGFSES